MSHFWSGEDQCLFFVYRYQMAEGNRYQLMKATFPAGAHPGEDKPMMEAAIMTADRLGFLIGYCPGNPHHSTLLEHGEWREVADMQSHLLEHGVNVDGRRLARWPGCPSELELILLDSDDLTLDEINALVNVGGKTGEIVERYQERFNLPGAPEPPSADTLLSRP